MSLRDYRAFAPLTDRISRAIQGGRLSHAYIIEGDSCIDKERFAKDLIKAALCREDPGWGCDRCAVCRKIDHDNYEDLYVVRPDDLSVKDASIAQLQEKLKSRPTGGRGNIAVIDHADTMTLRAQNRLLKTLEEPSPGTLILLLSENTENLLPTITSRCIVHRLGNFAADHAVVDLKLPRQIMDMVAEHAYFCEFKDKLTKEVKDRQAAFQLLDGMERLLCQYLRGEGSGDVKREKTAEYVKYVEEARRDLIAGVNYKYAIRNLILKIGG